MFNKNLFNKTPKRVASIKRGAEIVFVADYFADEYAGGAELTSEALIESCPKNIQKIKSSEVTMELLESGKDLHWIFGNFSQINLSLIPTIIANITYSILEYDFKFCAYRSVEKHKIETGKDCDCADSDHGIIISTFYAGSKSIWWMSEGQKEIYETKFPFLKNHTHSVVLSSVFNDKYFFEVKRLNQENKDKERKGWIVLGSESWIKGKDDAIEWCEKNDKDYEVLWGLDYQKTLEKLSLAEGFVYLPRGNDTCPRMVIEAKMLGCELKLNDYVQHRKEIWFDTDDELDTASYLYAARERFWNAVSYLIENPPTISAIAFLSEENFDFDNIDRNIKCLKMMEKIIFCANGSDEFVKDLHEKFGSDQVNISIKKSDLGKSALSLIDSNYIWIFKPEDYYGVTFDQSLKKLLNSFPPGYDALELPNLVLNNKEEKKLLVSEKPTRVCVVRNSPNILIDDSGTLIDAAGKLVPYATFYTSDMDDIRAKLVNAEPESLSEEEKEINNSYYGWLQSATESLPTIYNFTE